MLFSSNSARYVAGRQDVLQYSHSKGYEQTKALGRLDGRYTPLEQIDLLMQAIRLTVPRFDLESIESFLYTKDEITIINQIGLDYSDAGQNKKATISCVSMCVSILRKP